MRNDNNPTTNDASVPLALPEAHQRAAEEPAIPADLADFRKLIETQYFNTKDPNMLVKIGISRGIYRSEVTHEWTLHCGLYVGLVRRGCGEKPDVMMDSIAVFSPEETPHSIRLMASGSTVGDIQLTTPAGTVNGITFDERDRLLAWIKELRGVVIHYTADIFGFLYKNGEDQEQVFRIPFPEARCHSA